MTIVTDTKDWTWVLLRPCGQCGFDATAIDRGDVGALLRANAAAWQTVLTGADVARRPTPDVWSPLEYACHVRDVFRRFDERLALIQTTDDPLFANWDQDATAVADGYGQQNPSTVAGELTHAADRVARGFDEVDGADWSRPGRRSDGASFTIETLGRYLVHDPVHHLWDVSAPAR